LRIRGLKAGWPAALILLLVSGVSADAVTGTFTGSVALRGNYFYEQSTRVVAPALTATLVSPRGLRADATYLVDAITSASQATGVVVDKPFREIRHDIQGGIGHEFDLGKTQLDVTLRGRFSKEPDYRSRGFGFAGALSMNHRNSVLRLNGYFLDDKVYAVVRDVPDQSSDQLVAQPPDYKGKLDTLSLGVAWDQVLTPLATLTLGYDLSVMQGFTANPYRKVEGNPETHPDLRLRHAPHFWFAHYVPPTGTTLRVGYRYYHDDWELAAHATEARVYQELGSHLQLRLRYRYYTQSASYFWRPPGYVYTPEDVYRTADPKMAAFHDHTMGGQLRLTLGFLSRTWLRALRTAVLDGSLEYMIRTSRYGNGWLSQAGLLWPF
jgi:hypothetical protein